MTSYLKILPLFMMVMPGMISRVLFPGKCCRRDLLPLPSLMTVTALWSCFSLPFAYFRSGGLRRPGNLSKNLWQPIWLF